MVVRIYTLAKELQLDSKELFELCNKAGIPGKGSPLASLSEDEVVKLRAFIASRNAPAAPVRPVAAAAPAAPTSAPVAPAAEPATFRREDYIAPAGATNKPPVLGTRPERAADATKRPRPPRPAGDSGPAIRVAPMPSMPEPPPVKSQEPEPQKPDIKLPMDAIRASRSGGTPLEAHLKKHEAKRKADAAAPKPARGGPPTRDVVPPVGGAETKDRKRGKARGDKANGDFDTTLGGREQRRLSRRRTDAGPRALLSDEDAAEQRRIARLRRSGHRTTVAPRKTHAIIQLPCTIRTFSEEVGVKAPQVLSRLLSLGQMSNINSELSGEMIELLAVEFGISVEVRQEQDVETRMFSTLDMQEDPPESLLPRAPIVTFLGHVDHGKTSLLDRIIGTDVVSGESGGITQHIRAYRIEKDGRPITFVDTPGHEAFTQMRARGANVTDIAVLVVAADDGVMPQTEEAISHARAAGVPIVIALNKIDLPGVNLDRIYTQLVTNQLQPTEWGGDTELVKCSALTGQGIDTLLETLLTIAELHDYRANPDRNATGTCLEAELHEGRGVVAKMLVQNGTLKVGDVVVCGAAHGKVKAMYDTLRGSQEHDQAGPAMPVNVTGLDVAPGAGDRFYVLDDVSQARQIAELRRDQSRRSALVGVGERHVTLENLFDRLGGDEVQSLNLILRADVRGSIEAIQKELGKLAHPEVQVKILQATVGGVTEADVHLADASDAIIIGFNVVPDEKARALAQQTGVQIRRYDIIYQVTDDLRAALEGMLKPEQRDVELGRALVQRTFTISRLGTIAGCRVLSGTIERNARIRLIRENRIIGDYPLESLKREKDDAREVREGFECGMKLAGYNDVKEGDILEAYRVEEVARTL